MPAIKKFSFSDGVDAFFIAEFSQRRAYDAFCKVGDSRISFTFFRSRLYHRWGDPMAHVQPEVGGVWTQRPHFSGEIKREL